MGARIHRDLERVRRAAAEVFKPAGVELWLGADNPMFDGRTPIELVESDETDRVLQLLDALASGAYF